MGGKLIIENGNGFLYLSNDLYLQVRPTWQRDGGGKKVEDKVVAAAVFGECVFAWRQPNSMGSLRQGHQQGMDGQLHLIRSMF